MDDGSRISDEVMGRCRSCKDVTRHAVLTRGRERPGRVRCQICRDEHNFRAPPPTREEKIRLVAEKQRREQLAEERRRWLDLRPRMIETQAKDYSMDGLFRKKDIIRHPLFGLGQVQKVTGPRKVKVLFEDGSKVMRCQ